MKPATKYGEEKKNRSHPSRWCILMGALVASVSSMALFLFFFMIDRTGGGYYYLVYTLQYSIHTREVPYLCIYVPRRYGTLRSLCLCLGRYSIHGCCHTLIHYFFFESRKGGIIKVDGRLVGYTFARAYACVVYVAVCVCPWITTKT